MTHKDHEKHPPYKPPKVDIRDVAPHDHKWRVDIRDVKSHKHEWRVDYGRYTPIFMLSGWGIIIGCISVLFLYIGHRLDKWLGTEPTFMLGLLFLALVVSIGRLYYEAWHRRKEF